MRHVARAPGHKDTCQLENISNKKDLVATISDFPLSLKLLCHVGSVMTVEAAEISDQFSLSLSPSQSEELISFL